MAFYMYLDLWHAIVQVKILQFSNLKAHPLKRDTLNSSSGTSGCPYGRKLDEFTRCAYDTPDKT